LVRYKRSTLYIYGYYIYINIYIDTINLAEFHVPIKPDTPPGATPCPSRGNVANAGRPTKIVIQLAPIAGWWFGRFAIFPLVGNVIIPTDFNSMIFQRGRSTTNQIELGIEATRDRDWPATNCGVSHSSL
jgi:hypothetical protein